MDNHSSKSCFSSFILWKKGSIDGTTDGLRCTKAANTPVPNDGYRVVVSVLLFNEAGELLIQKRQSTKKGWPSYWDYPAGGTVKAGESCYQAAERELLEELGMTLSLEKIPSRLTVKFEEGWNELYFVQWTGANPELCLQ